MLKSVLSQSVPPVLILGFGVGGLFWLSAKEQAPEQVARSPVPPLVETIELRPEITGFHIRTDGNVVPRRVVTLSAEVAGIVIEKSDSIQGGHFVSQGTPLLKIDPQRYQLELDKLSSELLQVDSDLKKIETQEQGTQSLVELAEREVVIAEKAFARLQDLAVVNAAAITDLEAAERTELQTRNALRLLENIQSLFPRQRERLEAQHKLTRLRQQEAQLNLDRTGIIAPFDGIVTSVSVEQGNYVETGDELMTIEDTSQVEVACTLQMDDLYWLWNANSSTYKSSGQSENEGAGYEKSAGDIDSRSLFEVPSVEATVTWQAAGSRFQWSGRLARFEGRGIDQRTRTVPCRVIVDQPKRSELSGGPPALIRGMFVNVALKVTPNEALWRIPVRAVQPNRQVWTVRSGVLTTHLIKPVRTLPDSVLVRADSSDLKPGDRIVVSQLATALNGTRVREVAIDEDELQ